ncbi:MAG: phosphohydrolase, partial [Gammaproteobacteria bacterium]|nr:phosphohydrolase [Gammaproteobacteria bacterium]
MGIADIFEALTAKDRPYKVGKTLTESLGILGKFKENGHIDPELFDVFIREKVYLDYAKQFLSPEQIDAVDESRIPGYKA